MNYLVVLIPIFLFSSQSWSRSSRIDGRWTLESEMCSDGQQPKPWQIDKSVLPSLDINGFFITMSGRCRAANVDVDLKVNATVDYNGSKIWFDVGSGQKKISKNFELTKSGELELYDASVRSSRCRNIEYLKSFYKQI